MARSRARDHDEKRGAILYRAAIVFARDGYDRTSMSMLAAECGISKPLLYHYCTSKEALLFDIIRTHLAELVAAVEEADDASLPPEQRLEALVGALLEAYRDADAEHKVQLAALRFLPEPQQDELKGLERQLVKAFATTIRALNPTVFYSKPLLKPVTMSLFGMVNWAYMWFREDGEISRADYARLATGILVSGVKELGK